MSMFVQRGAAYTIKTYGINRKPYAYKMAYVWMNLIGVAVEN